MIRGRIDNAQNSKDELHIEVKNAIKRLLEAKYDDSTTSTMVAEFLFELYKFGLTGHHNESSKRKEKVYKLSGGDIKNFVSWLSDIDARFRELFDDEKHWVNEEEIANKIGVTTKTIRRFVDDQISKMTIDVHYRFRLNDQYHEKRFLEFYYHTKAKK